MHTKGGHVFDAAVFSPGPCSYIDSLRVYLGFWLPVGVVSRALAFCSETLSMREVIYVGTHDNLCYFRSSTSSDAAMEDWTTI